MTPAHHIKLWIEGDTLFVQFPEETAADRLLKLPHNGPGLTRLVRILEHRTKALTRQTLATQAAPIQYQIETELPQYTERLAEAVERADRERLERQAKLDRAEERRLEGWYADKAAEELFDELFPELTTL